MRLPTRCLCYQGSRPRQFSCRKAVVSVAKPKHKAPSNHESTSGFTLVLVVRLSTVRLEVLDGNAALAALGNAVLAALDLAVLTPLDLVVLAALAVLEGNAAMTLMFLLHLLFLHLLHLTLLHLTLLHLLHLTLLSLLHLVSQ